MVESQVEVVFRTPDEIRAYRDAPSSYVDYARFEGNTKWRKEQIGAFVTGRVYVPDYDYPSLDKLHDLIPSEKTSSGYEVSLADKKRATCEAILEIEANRGSGVMSPAESDLYADFHEYRLKKMMLVEAARHMRHASSSGDQSLARGEFMNLNREIFGELDGRSFSGMMNTEQARVVEFEAGNDRAQVIKDFMLRYFEGKVFGETEEQLLPPDVMSELNTIIRTRYADVLAAVPDTGDDIVYNANECEQIIQAALDACGLGEKGWQAKVNPKKANPATNADAKKVYLPTNTARTASQLRRLILHEVEVHARRAQNGDEAGLSVLAKGTADYADVEEGLGVLFECAEAGDFNNESFNRARDRYITAGLALGADGTPKDARATFELTWRLLAIRSSRDGYISEQDELVAKNQAYRHVENAFRGTNFAMPGIIYTKLKVYYEGLSKNARYLIDRKDDIGGALDQALLGKYDHTNEDEKQKVQSALAA